MKTLMTKLSALPLSLLVAGSMTFSTGAYAQDSARSLDELLEYVKQGKVNEARQNKEREARFLKDKRQQASLLKKAEQTRTREEERSTRLEKIFEQNKEKIIVKREALNEAKGSLNELFGHINSAAGDMRENFNTSLVSTEYLSLIHI